MDVQSLHKKYQVQLLLAYRDAGVTEKDTWLGLLSHDIVWQFPKVKCRYVPSYVETNRYGMIWCGVVWYDLHPYVMMLHYSLIHLLLHISPRCIHTVRSLYWRALTLSSRTFLPNKCICEIWGGAVNGGGK